MFDIKEELKKLPHQPGVYIMKDGDTILYVGKAVNLYNRVRQYFQSSRGKSPKILKMVSRVKEFEYIVTATETEALVLENNLIKQHRPPYNTMLKDDKQYPYIKATVQEAYPRIFSTRKIRRDGGKYFGPYTNVGAVRETLELMGQIFCLRTCRRDLPRDIGKERPCLNYYIHRCMGPCTGKVSQEEYHKNVQMALDFIEGKQKEVVKNLEQQMMAASEALDFEHAAVLRDQIKSIRTLQDRQIIEDAGSEEDRDVIAYAVWEGEALVQAFFIRSGKLIGREHFFMNVGGEETGGELIRAFIGQFYSGTPYIPKELLVMAEPEDREALEEWLSDRAGHRVYIKIPQRGEKYNLLELARKNAQLTLNQFGTRMRQEEKRTQGAMEELVELLGIADEEMPSSRIEAYDISNTFGFLSVGSMVVFENGRPLKNDYRKFRIKTVYGANDYASLQEVLRRRFSHALTELKERSEQGKDISLGKFTHLPDLILMDGGKGQVHIAEEVLREFDLEIPVAGMVKDDRHRTRGLYFHGEEVDLSGHEEVFHLVTRIQDEAHRFAITYHKKLRSDEQIQSVLEQIPGIGAVERKALIAAFGSVEAIKGKEVQELAAVDGMNTSAAEAVYRFFRQNESKT